MQAEAQTDPATTDVNEMTGSNDEEDDSKAAVSSELTCRKRITKITKNCSCGTFVGALGMVGDCCTKNSECGSNCCYKNKMCQLSLLCQAENSSKLARTKAGVSSSVPAK